MTRFALRHWTAIAVLIVVAGWALFYLPTTPSYTVFELQQAISARNGEAAASYVDFQKVVQNAGQEMVQDDSAPDSSASGVINQFIGRGMVDLFSGPMASLAQQWAVRKVDSGAKEVQMPPAAVAGAILMMHHSGDSAYTRWTDHKGQVWEVRMAREDGVWKIVQVKNVKQLLEKLQQHEEKQLNSGSP